MGSCLSSSNKRQAAPKNVRIVHLNGLVEDFDPPIFVNQLITSKPPKHFIITPSQLLSPLSKPLNSNAKLEPGRVYFLLPYSTLQPDVSPANLATLVKKLMEKANSQRPGNRSLSASPGASPMRSPVRGFISNAFIGSPGRSPTRFYEPEVSSVGYKSQKSVKAWRPLLDTIRERSFNRRSESDLQDKLSEKRN
ncbi:uncharacterized protein LOC116194807 [Punica granatum]|uniref:DUF4228 domain-containing protein n=2 Tax=Punica granatum TaxID=22663 RepID=A0A218XHK1_PUNGR|nr:uncharacterized protein LOC116194807 [Punica granatum]OWM84288.1 hypothetical protein CDL15_Pgr027057 [Punica granatum]PKI46135.1 hypothetical protein CRG98_033468 [Punica granatum]